MTHVLQEFCETDMTVSLTQMLPIWPQLGEQTRNSQTYANDSLRSQRSEAWFDRLFVLFCVYHLKVSLRKMGLFRQVELEGKITPLTHEQKSVCAVLEGREKFD